MPQLEAIMAELEAMEAAMDVRQLLAFGHGQGGPETKKYLRSLQKASEPPNHE